jgi:flagellar basal body-associated protein FliL
MDPATGGSTRKKERDPNFYAVVAISIVVLLLFLAAAWFVVMRHGRKMVPAANQRHEPNTSWSLPQHAAPPARSQI